MAITFEQFLERKEFYIGGQKVVSGYARVVERVPVSIRFSDEIVVDIQRIDEGSVVLSFRASISTIAFYAKPNSQWKLQRMQ